MKYQTNYATAVHWLGNSFILCNDIATKDNELEYEFDYYNEESDDYIDIYQYYLTNCTKRDVEFLSEHFGLLFAYSPMLDLYILCVDHYGTAWDYVSCDTDLEYAQRELGQSK